MASTQQAFCSASGTAHSKSAAAFGHIFFKLLCKSTWFLSVPTVVSSSPCMHFCLSVFDFKCYLGTDMILWVQCSCHIMVGLSLFWTWVHCLLMESEAIGIFCFAVTLYHQLLLNLLSTKTSRWRVHELVAF